MTCEAPDCDRKAVAKSMCMMHYKRARTGRPLTGPALGTESGHGRYGTLNFDSDMVLCHECGEWVAYLGQHARYQHDMSARDYKIKHGLPVTKSLLPPGAPKPVTSARSLQALAAHRDPTKASAARDADTYALVSAAKSIDPTAARAAAEATRLRDTSTCKACGVQWCFLPGADRRRVTCSPECADTLSAPTRFDSNVRRYD